MSFFLLCFLVGLAVLYPPVRRVIFQGVGVMMVGAIVLFVMAIVLVALIG